MDPKDCDAKDGEVHVCDDVQEDRKDSVLLLQAYPHLEAEGWGNPKVKEATEVYEMLLVTGVPSLVAVQRIVELYSPPRGTEKLEEMKKSNSCADHVVQAHWPRKQEVKMLRMSSHSG